jgi:hypothetical protein
MTGEDLSCASLASKMVWLGRGDHVHDLRTSFPFYPFGLIGLRTGGVELIVVGEDSLVCLSPPFFCCEVSTPTVGIWNA